MSNSEQKILSREALRNVCSFAKGRGRQVGFTSGTFDILHSGHVRYLEAARAECDLLVVAVNSDASVRRYKDPRRPIQGEETRAIVVAGLASVDYVFLFDELNTNESIRQLQPNLYIKGGDYRAENLSSTPLVRAYGGRVVIVPFVPGQSSSAVIERVLQRYGIATYLDAPPYPLAPAVFLDRDGVIIEHIDYLHQPARVRPIAGSLRAIKLLRKAGFRIVVVTNQPGIGIGYFSKDDFFAVTKKMLTQAAREEALIDRIFFCPHSVGDRCACRKPGSALLERAARELNLALAQSYVVGDMTSDIELAKRVGCKSILVKTGFGGSDQRYPCQPDFTAENLRAAADWILAQKSTDQISKEAINPR